MDLDTFADLHPTGTKVTHAGTFSVLVFMGAFTAPFTVSLASIPSLIFLVRALFRKAGASPGGAEDEVWKRSGCYGQNGAGLWRRPRVTTTASLSFILLQLLAAPHACFLALRDGKAKDDWTINVVPSDAFPSGTFMSPVWWCIGGWTFLAGLALGCRFHFQMKAQHVPRTLILYEIVYGFLFSIGVGFLSTGTFVLAKNNSIRLMGMNGGQLVGISATFLFPVLAIFYYGRRRIYALTALVLDRRRRREDGAFIAALLDVEPIGVGAAFWIKAPDGSVDSAFPPSDPRHFFKEGRVVEVRPDSFGVRRVAGVPGQPQANDVVWVPSSESCGRGDTEAVATELLSTAKENLRLVEWESLTEADMASSSGEGIDAAALTRPPRRGEKIDFFLSHSWHDDPRDKWAKMAEVAHSFKGAHGRYPTFWIDKFCVS